MYVYIAFAITKFSFCGAFFKRILAWERGILKLIGLKNVLMKLTKIKNCWSGIFNYAIKNTLELLNSRLFNINIWHRWKGTSVCFYFIFWSMYLSRAFFHAVRNQTSIKITKFNQKKIKKLMKRKCQVKF